MTVDSALLSPQGFTPNFVVESISPNPPFIAYNNQMWLVHDTGATGAWLGQENNIAVSVNGTGWYFIRPTLRQVVYDKLNAGYWDWNGTAWLSTSAFDLLGTSAAIPSSHFAVTNPISTPGFKFEYMTGFPTGVYRYQVTAGATASYDLGVNNACVILDAVIIQAAAAGGAGCTIDIKTTNAAGATSAIYPTFACSQANPAILRPTETSGGLAKLAANDSLTVIATDAGGNLPAAEVFITFALGV